MNLTDELLKKGIITTEMLKQMQEEWMQVNTFVFYSMFQSEHTTA